MGVLRVVRTTTKVLSRASYHLTYGLLAQPSVTRAFVETVANTIVDFVPPVSLSLPEIWPDELYPSIERDEVPFQVTRRTRHELPFEELFYLVALIRAARPAVIFEIGTHQGRTARLFAERSPERAKVYTLDLPVEKMRERARYDCTDSGVPGEEARKSPAAHKIVQLYGDSRTFDFRPFDGTVDLMFIDGDHAYETVKQDTANALRMIAPGGIIIWDDYQTCWPGVIQCVEELAQTHPVHHLSGTRLACYRYHLAAPQI